MLRTLFSGLLVLAAVADTAAQTAPAATKTTTHKTTTRRPAKARVIKHKTTVQHAAVAKPMPKRAPETGGRDDIGPGGNGAVGSTASADGKGQNVYAAPGMPVNVDSPKKVEGYNGPAPTKPRSGTTLTPR